MKSLKSNKKRNVKNKLIISGKSNITFYSFTLIELLIVVGIIGLMFAFILGYINPAMQLKKGRDGVRKSDLRQIQAALEMYRADIGSYPGTTNNKLNSNCPASAPTSLGNAPTCNVIYMQTIPKDPQNGQEYIYKANTLGGSSTYCIRTCLENVNDSQKDASSDYVDCQGYSYSSNCSAQTPPRTSYTIMNP